MSEAKFLNGLVVKEPHSNAPEFVKCNLSLKRQELITALSAEQDDWINLQVKVAKSGKWYAQIDEWKPENSQQSAPAQQAKTPAQDFDDDIPF